MISLLVRGVQGSLARCGLTRSEYTLAGGQTVRTPRVISAGAGAVPWVQIAVLAGQSPEDFAAQAPTIAHQLGVAQVWVIPLGRVFWIMV